MPQLLPVGPNLQPDKENAVRLLHIVAGPYETMNSCGHACTASSGAALKQSAHDILQHGDTSADVQLDLGMQRGSKEQVQQTLLGVM